MIRVVDVRLSGYLPVNSDSSSDVLQKHYCASLERRIMNKLNKVASLFATAMLATAATGVSAQTTIDNWVNSTGLPWKNGTSEYCWRNTQWTPATAHPDCDGALKKVAPAAVAPAPVAAPAAAPAAPAAAPAKPAVVAPVPVAPTSEKVTFAADAFFDFNKATLKPEGKAKLIGKGVETNRVYTEGKGEAQPVADNKTGEGRAKNRRVEIEVVGTRAVK
jgi:OOP family OmpA-OmpF porin